MFCSTFRTTRTESFQRVSNTKRSSKTCQEWDLLDVKYFLLLKLKSSSDDGASQKCSKQEHMLSWVVQRNCWIARLVDSTMGEIAAFDRKPSSIASRTTRSNKGELAEQNQRLERRCRKVFNQMGRHVEGPRSKRRVRLWNVQREEETMGRIHWTTWQFNVSWSVVSQTKSSKIF